MFFLILCFSHNNYIQPHKASGMGMFKRNWLRTDMLLIRYSYKKINKWTSKYLFLNKNIQITCVIKSLHILYRFVKFSRVCYEHIFITTSHLRRILHMLSLFLLLKYPEAEVSVNGIMFYRNLNRFFSENISVKAGRSLAK